MSGIPSSPTYALSSIIDNQAENTLLHALERRTEHGRELCIATAFFSLDALNLLGKHLLEYDRVRLLFGDDANPRQRTALLKAMRDRSDQDLLQQREGDATLAGLQHAAEVIKQGKFEARCYTKKKFHAKAYLVARGSHPPLLGIIGSGNFTRPGLTQNIELNVDLTVDQCNQLHAWYEARWDEAQADDVTQQIYQEISRQIALVEPYLIYLRTLLLWGDWVQGRTPPKGSVLLKQLDPHQISAVGQAQKIMAREGGVMICDGVGLGKSFVALALMEQAIQENKPVLLIAPKAILESSWQRYFRQYFPRHRGKITRLYSESTTWFGFEPFVSEEKDAESAARARDRDHADAAEGRTSRRIKDFELRNQKLIDLENYADTIELVIVDESHNFRKTNPQRYVNLIKMLRGEGSRKPRVALLTATPLNTEFTDVTSQFALIAGDHGTVGGEEMPVLRKKAVSLDRDKNQDNPHQGQLQLFDDLLLSVMHQVAIQRSRATCIELARAAGKPLRFPERSDPETIHYELSEPYKQVVAKTKDDFFELAKFINTYRAEVKRAAKTEDKKLKPRVLKLPTEGLRLSAYMPDRYRIEETGSLRDAQVESFLVYLVFTNVMKQLESSIVAFQSILKSLGAGLCARLHFIFGEEVDDVLAEHRGWINRSLNDDDDDEELTEDDNYVSGEESDKDDRISTASRSRSLQHGLRDFGPTTHKAKLWRQHIESDLRHLRDIFEYAENAARNADDEKLHAIAAQIDAQLAQGRKVLVFTQSARTAHYLEAKLPELLTTKQVRRITADVEGDTRTRLLHAFSPRYNPTDQPPLPGYETVDVLVCTDVLSEGVNLQEAGCILNYDIHWNPVRLIQRIGRVDRRLADDDPGHAFSILNVMPPEELEDILKLVAVIEGRREKISYLMGLDQSFFNANDEAGTLREFNAKIEGSIGSRDQALIDYSARVTVVPDALTQAQIAQTEDVPLGAFGVWKGAPGEGYFALFRVALRDTASESDQRRFAGVVGCPILLMTLDERKVTDEAEILSILRGTTPDEPSGHPTSVNELPAILKKLKQEAANHIPNRTQAVTVELICWMELRK